MSWKLQNILLGQNLQCSVNSVAFYFKSRWPKCPHFQNQNKHNKTVFAFQHKNSLWSPSHYALLLQRYNDRKKCSKHFVHWFKYRNLVQLEHNKWKNTFNNAQFKTKKELLILSPRKILIVNAWNIFFASAYVFATTVIRAVESIWCWLFTPFNKLQNRQV